MGRDESFLTMAIRRRIGSSERGARPMGRGVVVGALLLGTIGATACGGDGPAEPLDECLEAAGVSGPAVAIRGFAFSPDTLRIAAGTEVTWVNCEPEQVDPHTTTSDDGVWDSGLLFPGDRYARRFDQAGRFPYHCVPHPSMRAVVIVDGS